MGTIKLFFLMLNSIIINAVEKIYISYLKHMARTYHANTKKRYWILEVNGKYGIYFKIHGNRLACYENGQLVQLTSNVSIDKLLSNAIFVIG